MSCKPGVFHRGRLTALSLALIALSGAGCSRQPTSTLNRIAVLRFENLTPDVSLDWMGRAASEIIAHEIDAGQTRVILPSALHSNSLSQFHPVSAPGESAERGAAIAAGATRIVIGQISRTGNRLILDITERDPATGKTIHAFTVATPNPDDLYSVADAAARRLSSEITPFDSKNNQAIASWALALEDTDYAKLTGDYSRAVQADPEFASAWLGWATNASSHGDRAAAEKVLAEAGRHANRFSEIGRARLKLLNGQFAGDRTAILAALNELGRLRPDDADNVRSVADQNFAARQYQNAVAGYRRLTQITPNNPLVWNQLGYALMYGGDYDGAMSALQTYQKLAPKDPNPLDSQGDVAFAFGRFGDAEKLYGQASSKDRGFENSSDLYKMAVARLMTGDIAGADQKFEAYAAARTSANDISVPFRRAQWNFFSGRHQEALSSLGKLASAGPSQLRALVLTQAAIWDLQLGHRDRALQESGEALKTGGASPSALIARFAAEDARTAEDWSARADRMFAAPQLAQFKRGALAYALYLSHQWQAAEPVWKEVAERASPDDSITPVIYAQILVQLNRARDAGPYVRLFPLLHPAAAQEFQSLAYPQILETRAAVLSAEGKTADADASRKIFGILWGTAHL